MTDHYPQITPPDDLLVKHLLGEGSPEEDRLALEWITATPDHARYFSELQKTWQHSGDLEIPESPDEDEAWKRFRTLVSAESTPPSRVISFRKWLQVAAAVVVLLGAGWLVIKQWDPLHRTITLSAANQVRQVTLPDGSQVTLNAHSTLSYPGNYGAKTRTVRIQGEGFFDIVPQKNRPFVAETNHLTVTVLGTSFNIYDRKHSTEVVVETGRVEVTDGKSALYLGAHEKAVFSGDKRQLEKQSVHSDLYNYYRTGTFQCNKTPLRELIATLNEAYQAHITIENASVGALPITTTFRYDQPLDSILAIISQTFQVTISQKGNRIIVQ